MVRTTDRTPAPAQRLLSAGNHLPVTAWQTADEVPHRDLPHRAQLCRSSHRQPAPRHRGRLGLRGADTRGSPGPGRPAASPAAGDTVPVRAELVLPEQRSPGGGQPARLRSRTRGASRSPRWLPTPIRNRRLQDSSQVFSYPFGQEPKQHRVHTTFPLRRTRVRSRGQFYRWGTTIPAAIAEIAAGITRTGGAALTRADDRARASPSGRCRSASAGPCRPRRSRSSPSRAGRRRRTKPPCPGRTCRG